jgi:hypothetical protein
MSRVNYIHSEHHWAATFQWAFIDGVDRSQLLHELQGIATKLNITFTEVDLFSMHPSNPTRIQRVKAYVIGVRPILTASVERIIADRLADIGLTSQVVSPWRTSAEDLELFTPLV